MICKRCETTLPDNATVCPVCGMSFVRRMSKRSRLLRSAILFSPFASLTMNVINAYLLLTASHYATNLSNGILYAKQIIYQIHPGLSIIDTLFGVFLLVFPVLSILSLFHMQKARQLGLILMIASNAATLLWSILYPVTTYAITGIATPVMSICIVLWVIFSALTVGLSIYLSKSTYFVY